jgi:hypothetical protein
MYRSLDALRIQETVTRLEQRIRERFPGAGLLKVCGELRTVVEEAEAQCRWIRRPHTALRAAVAAVVGILVLSFGALLFSFGTSLGTEDVTVLELIQVLEAGINDLVLIGAAIFFLVTYEGRLKQRRALQSLNDLRALAHVIDMHQLTKDPVRIVKRPDRPDTPASPEQRLTAFELSRYLDYCSEMLSLIGKLAALYAQSCSETPVLSAVNEIETVTTGLSQKIWQKITNLERLDLQSSSPAPQ